MVPLSFRKVLLLHLVLLVFTCLLLCASSEGHLLEENQVLGFSDRRMLLEVKKDEGNVLKEKSKKNQTKLIKPNSSPKNQTKLLKTNLPTKNQTKLKSVNSTKATSTSVLSKTELKKLNSTSLQKKYSTSKVVNSTKATSTSLLSETELKKLNSTSLQKKYSTPKASNFTKTDTTSSTKKSSDLIKPGSPKNKTTKPTSTNQNPSPKVSYTESQKQNKTPKSTKQDPKTTQGQANKQPMSLGDQEDDDDLISEFRDLPSRFQQTIQRDFESISITSKKYMTKANKEMTKGFKPIVGNKYASTIASIASVAFVLIPLILALLIVNHLKAYFSIQKVLIFIQAYLSIYFSILCLTSLVTAVEPLKFLFNTTSQSTYFCLMILQTLGYILYLLLLLMHLVLVFSTASGLGSRLLSLGQTLVGFAVGLHYYVAVFHRAVLHQPPKTNWKVHGVYATCFLSICLFAKADRRKKTYLEEGGEERKKN
ncbi:hypothetical protein K2173_014579 [Erythroxylum novogranatense]|uniref:Uncharacterized protein n=1 Tax=Erythroxylum novogranatense TaxID=1862640 RepID=A0AAV8TEZ5_9ROSI|nr:hypothetical protein K2173_014579 [Erythroxylum novogranatense]